MEMDSIRDVDKKEESGPKKSKAETEEEIPPDMARDKMKEHWVFKTFLFISVALSIAEAILIGFGTTTLNAQIVVLAASSVLAVFGIFFTAAYYPSDEELIEVYPLEFPGQTKRAVLQKIEINKKRRERYVGHTSIFVKAYYVIDGEVLMELVLLIVGWIFIKGNYQGVAALRALRVFRLMWYFELIQSELPEDYVPENHYFSPSKAAQLCIFYLEQLSREFLTEKIKRRCYCAGNFLLCDVHHCSRLHRRFFNSRNYRRNQLWIFGHLFLYDDSSGFL